MRNQSSPNLGKKYPLHTVGGSLSADPCTVVVYDPTLDEEWELFVHFHLTTTSPTLRSTGKAGQMKKGR